MRVLFTASPAPAHFHSQVPIATALQEAGHAVAFASGPNIIPRIEQLGLSAFPVGPPPTPPSGEPPADPPQWLWWVWEQSFVGPPAAARLADLLPVCETWQPDLIVRENTEFAGCIAAEARGIPHAVVQNGNDAVLGALPREPLVQRLDTLRAAAGLPPDPDLAMPYRYLQLLPVPRSFHDPALPLPPTAHFLRPLTFDRTGDEGLPAWVDALPPHPIIYMTLGTVFNRRADLFAVVIAALREEPVNLIITVGRDQDPADYGPQPDNVHIERYIRLSLLLRQCDLVVTNGGSGTLTAALAHGLPLVVVPVTADQPDNAARCAVLGLGAVIALADLTPATARQAVLTVRDDPTCRVAAERFRVEIAALPGQEHAVALLERLAAEKQPLIGPLDTP